MIEAIKEALEKTTPGPWSEGVKQVSEPQENYREIRAGKGFFGDKKKHQGFGITGLISPADAHLIANTPTYIRYLLDELEKAQKEITRLNGKVDYKSTIVGYSVELIEDLEKENAAMKEALEWYGDMEHYTVLPGAQLTGTEKDMGYRARKVLSTLTKEAPNE